LSPSSMARLANPNRIDSTNNSITRASGHQPTVFGT
jgi:hypothetical protein